MTMGIVTAKGMDFIVVRYFSQGPILHYLRLQGEFPSVKVGDDYEIL